MSINQNSWKTLPFDAVAATVKRLDLEKVWFENNFERPNFIQIKNINTSDILYVGDDKTVSSTNYRLSINPLATGKSINIDGYSDIYVLIASNTNKLEINYAYDSEPSSSDLDGTQDITVINQSLTVGNVGITSIAAGTNTIGKFVPTDGTDDLVIESDGSINVNFNESLPSGNNNIGDVDINSLPSLPAGDNNIGNVDIASSLPAGTNNIGKGVITGASGDVDSDGAGALKVAFVGSLTASSVKIEDSDSDELEVNADGSINANITDITAGEIDKPATTPNIYRSGGLSADTEDSQALPANCTKFTVGLVSKDDAVTWVLKFGTGGTEFSFNGSETYTVDGIYLASQTLYYEVDTASEEIQIIAWS